MNATHSISIAVLTEDQEDVEVINSTLRSAGHFAHCHWIDNPGKLSDTLAAERVELIIVNCDRYRDSVRRVIKEKELYNPEVPVIALQREATEAAIHEAMKEGAVDLVSLAVKKRLTAVVSRELRALRTERALNSSIVSASGYKQQVRELMQASSASIALVQEGIIVDANDAWLKRFKLASLDEIRGMPLMDSFDGQHHAALKGALVACVRGKWQPGEELEARSGIDDSDSPLLKLGFSRIAYDGAPCVQVSIKADDAGTQEPTKLVHDALKRDPTTLFFHRTQFLERLQKRLARKPKSGTHVLAYVKLDNFAEVRDKVGFIASEDVLMQFSEILRKRMHPRDVAGRFEGTSLLVLLERGSARDGQVWGQQLCNHIAKQTFDVGDASTNLTCTVGVCGVSDVFSNIEELVRATFTACQAGREQGGNTSALNDEVDQDTRQQEFDRIWVEHLKSALMENRFGLAQLPIAGLRSDSIRMFDLLVRMIDEQGKSVLPSEFLPAAERNNMMKNIDRWMIKAAAQFCDEHDADRVFVRLSRQSVLDSSTVPWIEHEFDQAGFDCSRLVLQFPEKEAAKHIKQTRELVAGLRKLGIGFALEHYGIDQERFQILDMLKPDYIKIDGALMHSLMTDADMQSSVQKIVAGANRRNIRTIAERVENANAMAVLFQLGLDFMQGHYVHEPEVVLEDLDSGEYNTLEELKAAQVN